MKKFKIIFALLFLSICCVACNNAPTDEASQNDKTPPTSTLKPETNSNSTIPLLNIKDINWTIEEKAYIEALNDKGYLRVATKVNSTVYQPQSDGSIKGFHYSVLKEFADLAMIEIEVELVNWNDYFYKEGEDVDKAKNDPDYSYVPSLIEEVDLYLDGITSIPWREKLFDIIKFVPSKQLVVSRKDNIPLELMDLNNKTCVMVKDTSMELNIDKVQEEEQININYLYVDEFNVLALKVAEGEADFTVLDSDAAFASNYKYDNLTVAMPVSDVQVMGWAISKNDTILNSVLSKYLDYAQETNILDKYWEESYGVTFIDYLKVLQLE